PVAAPDLLIPKERESEILQSCLILDNRGTIPGPRRPGDERRQDQDQCEDRYPNDISMYSWLHCFLLSPIDEMMSLILPREPSQASGRRVRTGSDPGWQAQRLRNKKGATGPPLRG